MSVRVNLLPRELAVRERARRTRTWTIIACVLFVLVLGGIYLVKLGEVEQARTDRDDAQAEVSRLEAEVAQLEEFRQLAAELEARNNLLAASMASEISWARILNDLSLAFPTNASLQTLAATQEEVAEETAEPGAPDFGEAIATVEFSGYSVEEYAPGVEAVLIEFDKVRSFFNVFLSTAAQDEIGGTEITNFDSSVDLDEEAYTRRYDDGLPTEVAP